MLVAPDDGVIVNIPPPPTTNVPAVKIIITTATASAVVAVSSMYFCHKPYNVISIFDLSKLMLTYLI